MSLYNNDILPWRNSLNPLLGLTIRRAVTLLHQAQLGFYADLSWLESFVERRDAVVRAVLKRRLGAMKKLTWAVKPKEDAKKPEKQQKHLQDFFNGIDNMTEAVATLSHGEFRGIGALEKHYTGDGDVFHLEPVPMWFLCRRIPSRKLLYNEKALNTNVGIPIDYEDFVIRETAEPVNEISIIAFIRKSMAQKDWDAFVETYGIPPLFVELPPNSGSLQNSGTATWQEVAERVIADSRGVLPSGAQIKTVDAGSRGINPFQEHIDYQDKCIVLAATGGLLTTLNDATGMGSGQSELHEATFNTIAIAEAMEIGEVVNRQLAEPELNKAFPGEDIQVYWELEAKELDLGKEVIADAVSLNGAGYRVDVEQLEEKTGYKLEDVYQKQMDQQQAQLDAQQAQGGAGNDGEGQDGAPAGQPGQADPTAGNPYYENRLVEEAVNKALQASDGNLLGELERLSRELPALLKNKRLGGRRHLAKLVAARAVVA